MSASVRTVFVFTTLCIVTATAWAERRGPLEGQPAVRHRKELRSGRFEIGPSFAFSLGRSYRHVFLAGAKLEYHFNDWLSVGADIAGGVNWDSGLTDEIASSYASASDEFATLSNRFSDIKMAADLRAVFTPFTGKIAIFSALFLAYDFYVFGGFGMAITGNNSEENTPPVDVDSANEGFQPGIAWGLGMHLWVNRFVAIGIELRDLVFNDNPSGGDLTRGLTDTEQANGGIPIIDGDDTSFSNHFFAGLSVTFYLPTKVAVSR